VALTQGELKELLASHGLRPSRALGQNFVVDHNTLRRIVRLAGIEPEDQVVEVGAGLGALTIELAETGAHVTAVEIDKRLVPLLRSQVGVLPVRVVEADATRLDWETLLHSGKHRQGHSTSGWKLVANLPYNVAVPVVARVLDEAPNVLSMLVMVQREVGERLVASPGDSSYGAVSVKLAYHATARVVGEVPASVFVPKPRVASSLVRIVRRETVAVDPVQVSPQRLFSVVRSGFAHRRKMLRGALAGVVSPEAFAAAGVDPTVRAQELSVEQWGRLAAFDEVGEASGRSM